MVHVIGVGPGGTSFLTKKAIEKIEEASIILGSQRLIDIGKKINPKGKALVLTIKEMEEYLIENSEENIVALVSGDVGFYSISKSIRKKLNKKAIYINGLNSMQYFAQKLNMEYDDLLPISFHGRNKSIKGYVSYNPKIFLLTGGENKAHTLIKELWELGLDKLQISVGENLSLNNERIVTGNIYELIDFKFEDLAVMIIENPNYCNKNQKLWDKDFIRDKAPMTKEAVRTIGISHLNVQPEDIVYDIGAGTGSCSIELALKASNSTVYAIEKNSESVELIKKNIANIGSYNVEVLLGKASDIIQGLPAPDKVFIGGSSGELDYLIGALIGKNPKVEFVVTAITLETLIEAKRILENYGYNLNISCINASHNSKVGPYNMMKADNPVYIISSGGR